MGLRNHCDDLIHNNAVNQLIAYQTDQKAARVCTLQPPSQVFVYSAVLKRPLSASPALFLGCLGSLGGVCLLIASVWAYFGATWVLVFAGLDVLALILAAVWCVRHATDYERVSLSEDTLFIERQSAHRLEQWRLPRFYVRFKLDSTSSYGFMRPRLSISAQQQTVLLGAFCHTAALLQLKKQLHQAMRGGRA